MKVGLGERSFHAPQALAVAVAVQVLNAARVERRAAPQHAVHDVALHEQQLSEVAAVLASDACTRVGFYFFYWVLLINEPLHENRRAKTMCMAFCNAPVTKAVLPLCGTSS
jgi:hypothetical protein